MATKRNPILEAITNPSKNFLAAFLIGTLLVSLISDGFSSLFWGSFSLWLQDRLELTDKSQLQNYMLFGLVLLLLFLIYGTNLAQRIGSVLSRWRLFGAEVPDRASVVPLERTSPGLIVIMSTKTESPAEVAIRHHWNHGQEPHLKHCWIICTESALEYAQAMKMKLLADNLDEHQCHLYYGSYELKNANPTGLTLTVSDRDADDPDIILNLVNAIYADAQTKGLDESDILVDFTGGTKPMGVGAVLACAAPSRHLEYLAQTEPPQLVEVKVSYKLKPTR